MEILFIDNIALSLSMKSIINRCLHLHNLNIQTLEFSLLKKGLLDKVSINTFVHLKPNRLILIQSTFVSVGPLSAHPGSAHHKTDNEEAEKKVEVGDRRLSSS